MFTRLTLTAVVLSLVAANANAQLPDPGVEIVPGRTALLIMT